MAISFKSHTTAILDGSSTATQKILSFSKPVGLSNNDLLLIHIGSRQADGSARALSASLTITGFTKLANGGSDLVSNIYRVWTFGKVITDASSETTTYTVSLPVNETIDKQNIAGIAAAFSGVDTSNPYNVNLVYSNQTTTVTVTYSAITTTVPNTMLVLAGISQRSVSVTFNGGITKIADPSVVTTNAATAYMGYVLQPSVGSSGDKTSYINDTARVQQVGMFALNPAATGLTITSVNAGNDVYSEQTLVKVVGTGLSNVTSATYKGAACSAISKSSSLSITMTFPNFFTNNIKVGAQHALKVRG